MDALEFARLRFQHQRLLENDFLHPAAVTQWLGAVQSQDYEGAKWAIGQRSTGLNDARLDAAYNASEILRTHLMRPTWHFVAAEDLRWMLALTAPQLKRRLATTDRKIGLDAALFAQTNTVIARALQDGAQRTRQELAEALRQAGIEPGGVQRLAHIMFRAEQEGLICSGAKRGKQFTYALLDDRVDASQSYSGEEALAELAWRYFRSHGPATVADFSWWGWLPVAEARKGIELQRSRLKQVDVDGKVTWYVEEARDLEAHRPTAYLLPNFDEAVGSYKDHRPSVRPSFWQTWDETYNLFTHHLVIDGLIVGGWKRLPQKDGIQAQIKPFGRLSDVEREAVLDAAARYAQFLERPVTVTWVEK